MAFCFGKFSVGWTIYLMCLLFIRSESTLHDELFYKYDLLDTKHSVDETTLNFIKEGDKPNRSRRDVTETHKLLSLNSTSLQNDQSLSNFGSVTEVSNSRASPEQTGSSGSSIRLAISSPNGGSLQSPQGSLSSPVPVKPPAGGTNSAIVTSNSVTGLSNGSNTVSPERLNILSAEFGSKTDGTGSSIVDRNHTDIAIQFPEEITNATLKEENITKTQKDNHMYYNSTFIVDEKIGQELWVELADKNGVIVHAMLSDSHRRAATVQLSFNFPFYGHLVTNVTIATGGFLFTGDHVHSWLAATQYIAPLMANFDNSISKLSFVKYYDNGTAFVVLWENVSLKDSPESGNFTFEVILHKNGDIVFIYKNIPVPVESIKDDQHPVKVGLSDAYIIDRTIFFVKRKTIYEYHRVNFSKEDIKNWTIIYLNALPTCHDMKDCESCINANINFECKWCPAIEKCSTGLYRSRQEWLTSGCDKTHVSVCSETTYAHRTAAESSLHSKHNGVTNEKSRAALGSSGVISLLLIITSLAATAFFLLYAYRNPHSTPGQFLIKYRPSQWSWRRGEARYTAATIHM